jgi:tetratricopeptide (TPR) repeat protein
MKVCSLALCCMVVASAAAAEDDPLTAARDLYAAAAYEEALTVLNSPETAAASERAEQYRAFCLFALGRTAEARAVADGLIEKNPLLELEADASPRVAAIFTDARQRLLPGIIREKYRAARASIDRKDYAAAEPQLETVKRLLDHATIAGSSDETTNDLRVLVDGFLNLSRANASARAPVPAQTAAMPTSGASASRSSVVAAPVYTIDSSDVVPPVALRQEVPNVPGMLASVMARGSGGARNGTLEVVIDEKGNVEQAIMRERLHPAYERLLLASVKGWKYQPALKGETPVRFVKRIGISIDLDGASVSR